MDGGRRIDAAIMPKPAVDALDASVAEIDSTNTIVNDAGVLRAYNTDYVAAQTLIERHALPRDARVVPRGGGDTENAVATAFRDAGFDRGDIVARDVAAGQPIRRVVHRHQPVHRRLHELTGSRQAYRGPNATFLNG